MTTDDDLRDAGGSPELDGKIEQTARALELTQAFVSELDVSQTGNWDYLREMTERLETQLAALKARRRPRNGKQA